MQALEYFGLSGRVALVTGGGAGLGRATALAFAEAGADVAVTARSTEGVLAVVEEIEARGRRGLAITGDLHQMETPARLVSEVMQAFGRLDILVNNAGGADDQRPYPLSETSEEHWRALMQLNLDAVWRCTKEASKVMESDGSIVNISSIMSLRPNNAGYGPYGISKAAVNYMTEVFAKELAPRRIRVNAVAPGPVPTERSYRDVDAEKIARDRGIPLGRVGRPDDVAMACLYFAAPASSWCTGQTLAVAGGI